MEAKHTPGPWYTASTGNHQALICSEPNGTNIAVVYDGEADAAVLAAAPDLLKQCKAALRYLQHPDVKAVTHGFALSGAVIERRIEDAISEAEGGLS